MKTWTLSASVSTKRINKIFKGNLVYVFFCSNIRQINKNYKSNLANTHRYYFAYNVEIAYYIFVECFGYTFLIGKCHLNP